MKLMCGNLQLVLFPAMLGHRLVAERYRLIVHSGVDVNVAGYGNTADNLTFDRSSAQDDS